MRFLPTSPIPEEDRTPSSLVSILLLSVSSFFLLYILQRSYYDFYNDTFIIVGCALLAALGMYTFFHAEHNKAKPFLKVRDLMQTRYLQGVALFCYAYVVLGANNYILPYFLQTGLGYSWDTIGTFQAIGLTGTLATWVIMAILLPKHPAPKKFFILGFIALGGFGWLLSSLTPSANMWSNILPALILNGCFVMLVMSTAAMQTFRDVLLLRRLLGAGNHGQVCFSSCSKPSTSASAGAWAPAWRQDMDAQAAENCRRSLKSAIPSNSAASQPAIQASPAPTVSSTFTAIAG